MIASESVARKIRLIAKTYLDSMQNGRYDFVWNDLITEEAAKLLSTALFPVHIYKENKVDEILRPVVTNNLLISIDEAFSFGFQQDIQKIRTSFFHGLASGMNNFGWYNAILDDSIVFLEDEAAILIEKSNRFPPLIILFIKQPDGEYKIDFEAIVLFSMPFMPFSLYHIGIRAQELGLLKSAISYYELAASFSQPYSRIKLLMLENFIVSKIITDTRKQELLEEENYILLSRHQVLLLLSSPKVGSMPVNMGDFLANTFKGYTDIPNMALDDNDINQLQQLDDSHIRQALAKLLNGVNPVLAQREANKPHGPHEISDMELVVQYNENIYRLSIPIKSAIEINSLSVPVQIAYQIIRPFLSFPDGIVVFVTVKPCSQPLHNYIKAANDILGLHIEVIEYKELGKLLKINGLLQ